MLYLMHILITSKSHLENKNATLDYTYEITKGINNVKTNSMGRSFAALVWIVGCNNSADTAVNEIAGEKTTAEKATENPTDDSKSDETSEESKATETPGSKADDAFPSR